MMTDNRVETIFQDAETLYTRAIEELDRGNIRDAAEKAWGATLRATNALILAKTSKEMEGPKKLPENSISLLEEIKKLMKSL
jgi:hypothetical protein